MASFISAEPQSEQEHTTVRGKILEGENFGELMALKSLARKKLANPWVVY